MKIFHCSDWHGQLSLDAGDVDVIVCSGDLFPNKSRGDRDIEVPFQTEWLQRNLNKFARLATHPVRGSLPFLFTSGNHDFIDPCPMLREYAVNAINLDDRMVTVDGVRFFGLPWIPFIIGEWAFELPPSELTAKTHEIPLDDVDVLVSHCPPSGFLDMDENGLRRGNSALTSRLYYDCERWPKAILTGHIHNSYGMIDMSGPSPASDENRTCIISNAATGSREVEIK